MSDNVNIIVQDTINEIVVNTAVIVETIDINVQTPIDEVTIITNPNNYIVNINRIIGEQVQSDWNQNDSQEPDYIKNKPTIPGAQEQSDWNETDVNKPPYIKNKPAIPTQTSDLINNGDGSSGSYFLTEANIVPQVNSDWNAVGGKAEIFNKPTIPAEQVNSDWNAVGGKAEIFNKPTIPSISGLATITYVDQQDALKVDKVTGYGLSQNDFTNTLKTKLDGIEAGAQVNVNADWNATTGDAEILNKPTIPSITNLVPYTGATLDVQLGPQTLSSGGRDETLISPTGISVVDDRNGPSQEVTIAPNEIKVRNITNNQDVRILSNGIQFFDTSFQQSAFPPTGGTDLQYIKGNGTLETFPTNFVVKNADITGATKTKITYDSKGLVTSGTDATTNDIADSTNKRYQTENQKLYNDATSSIQTQLNAKANDNAVVHLTGIETITGQKTFNPAITASGAIAKGTILTPTLTAAANGDTLVGLDIAPTFTNGAFTGLSNYAIRHTGDIVSTVSNSYNLGNISIPYNTIYTRIIRDITQISYRSDNQGWFNNANTQTAKLFSTGNLVLQNGGTFTDLPSARLQVNSTTQGILAPRMTNSQKIAISSPATGLLAFDTDLATLSQYNGSAWVAPYKYINTTSSVVVATVAETIVSTATIPANAFNSSDVMKFLFEIGKSTTTVGVNIRIKINTSNTLTGATTIATYTVPLANTYALMKRNFILSGGSLYGYNFTNAASITDEITSTISNNSTTYNTASTLYVFFTMQLGSTLDNATFLMANITN